MTGVTKMPNIYFVLSEVIEDFVSYLSLDPPENYCIAKMVVAKNHSQAKYLAWKNDKDFEPNDLRAMPKFRCNLRKKDVNLPIGVIRDTSKCPDEWWE